MSTASPGEVPDRPVPNRRSTTSSEVRKASGCLIAVVLAPFLLYLPFQVAEWRNNAKLDDLKERFLDYPPPPKTRFGDFHDAGSIALRGNGDHCDYLIRFSLITELSEQEIFDYYTKARIRGVEDGPATVTVYSSRHTGTYGGPGEIPVLVELFDGTEAGLDLRCH